MSNQVVYIVKVLDQATRPLRNIARSTAMLTRNLTKAGSAMKKMGYHFTSLRSIISAAYGAAIVAFPIKKAAEFESLMIDIKRVSSFASKDSFAKFREGLIKTSIYLGKLPKEIGELGYEVAKFINDPKLLKGYIDLAASVSRSFDIPGKEAAEQIGKISSKMGLSLKGMEGFLDAVNYASDRSATSVKNQLKVIARVATNMKGMRIPPNLAAGWANFADRIKATPRIAAKGLEMFFREVGKLRGGYRKLFRPGADTNKILITFLEKLKKMPEITRRMRLDKVFPARVANFVNEMVGNMGELHKSLALVGDKSGFAGSMQRELALKLESATTAMERVRAVMDAVAITIGNAFLPLIKELSPIIVDLALQFREFVKQHPLLLKIVMGAIALVTVLTGATVVIGLLAIAFGTLFSPITAIVLAVLGIGAGLAYLYTKSEGLRQAFDYMLAPLKAMWDSITSIFGNLFGSVDSKNVWGGLFWFIESVAIVVIGTLAGAFNILMVPIRIVLFLIESIVDLFANFGKYADMFSNFASGISGAIGSELSGLSDMFSNAGSVTADFFSSRLSNIDVNGGIEVSAAPGSTAKVKHFDKSSTGNFGMNMAN